MVSDSVATPSREAGLFVSISSPNFLAIFFDIIEQFAPLSRTALGILNLLIRHLVVTTSVAGFLSMLNTIGSLTCSTSGLDCGAVLFSGGAILAMLALLFSFNVTRYSRTFLISFISVS